MVSKSRSLELEKFKIPLKPVQQRVSQSSNSREYSTPHKGRAEDKNQYDEHYHGHSSTSHRRPSWNFQGWNSSRCCEEPASN